MLPLSELFKAPRAAFITRLGTAAPPHPTINHYNPK